jgi:hypothetical protein
LENKSHKSDKTEKKTTKWNRRQQREERMYELPIEPPEERRPAEGYEWSPKDDCYWDMRVDMARDGDE